MEEERSKDILHKLADILCSPPYVLLLIYFFAIYDPNLRISLHHSVSIELLPGGFEDWEGVNLVQEDRRPSPEYPFLFSNGNLGIPKNVLYKLYLAALALFRSSRFVPGLCRVVTCTILLANPAHQTALNARKRLVQTGDLHPEKELLFIEVLIRGLSSCAKESILWYHRRWLFNQIYEGRLHLGAHNRSSKWKTTCDLFPLPDIPPEAIVHELSVIRCACESYPRNYHAWTHWHFLMDIVHTASFVNEAYPYFDILIQELNTLKDWVEHHVSDHSSVFRLCCLGRLLEGFENPSYSRFKTSITNRSLVEHAFSLLTSYPTHESLWIYLRDSAALLSASDKQRLIEEVKSSPLIHSPFSKRFVTLDINPFS